MNEALSYRVGMILPSANVVAECEMPELLPANISVHTTRLRLTGSSLSDLLGMQEQVEHAAALLADAEVDLIAFHCTAVSTLSDAVEASIVARAEKSSGLNVMTTGQALVDELYFNNIKQIVLVTPYLSEITGRESAFFARRGVEVLSSFSAGISLATDMPKLPAEHWQKIVLQHRHPDADAYLLSCNGIWSNKCRSQLELELGRPVITSNSALAAYCVRASDRKFALSD